MDLKLCIFWEKKKSLGLCEEVYICLDDVLYGKEMVQFSSWRKEMMQLALLKFLVCLKAPFSSFCLLMSSITSES